MRKEKVKVYLCSSHVWKCVLCSAYPHGTTNDDDDDEAWKSHKCAICARARHSHQVCGGGAFIVCFFYIIWRGCERCMCVYASDLDSVKEQIIRFMDDTALCHIHTNTNKHIDMFASTTLFFSAKYSHSIFMLLYKIVLMSVFKCVFVWHQNCAGDAMYLYTYIIYFFYYTIIFSKI